MTQFSRRFALSMIALALFTPQTRAQGDSSYVPGRARTHAGSAARPLTGPSNASPVAIVAQYLRGIGRNIDPQSLVGPASARGTALRIEQRAGGLRIYGAYAKASISAEGELLHLIENLFVSPGAVGRPQVDESQALSNTLKYLYPDETIAIGAGRRQGESVRFARTAFFHEEPTVTRVVYPAVDGSFGAGYVVTTWTEEKNLLHETLVGTAGEVLFDELRTNSDSYNVFRVNPQVSPQATVDGSTADDTASPDGWLFSGDQNTLNIAGNNVHAYLDADANNTADTGVGTTVTNGNFLTDVALTEQPTTAANRNVAVQNLFYLNNLLHDMLYGYGFTESAGNFQEDNFGKGGLGSDSVNAEAQDGGDTDNANFATPSDGSNPRMQMYLWNSNPDSQVVVNGSSYLAFDATFGPDTTTAGVTGALSATTPQNGCSRLSENLTGKIAVIDRGTCEFVTKVVNAQSAGASAVIVVNNISGDGAFAMGGTSRRVRIPSVMVSKNSGDAIKAAIPGPATVEALDIDPLQIDGDLDGDVVFHEYGHGLTWRMIGGMSGPLGGAVGEGASDVLTMLMTRLADASNYNVIGAYAALDPKGIRRAPYDDSYPNTYADVDGGEVHADGEIYAAAMRKVIELYIADYGDPAVGVQKAFEAFVGGMNFTPSTPAFEDMRDGMLQYIDQAQTGDECLVWQGFAQFGIGEGASGIARGKRVVITESTTLPAQCQP